MDGLSAKITGKWHDIRCSVQHVIILRHGLKTLIGMERSDVYVLLRARTSALRTKMPFVACLANDRYADKTVVRPYETNNQFV